MKSIDLLAQDVEMSDMAAHRSSAKTYVNGHRANNVPKISSVNNQTDRELPAADDEHLLPTPAVLEVNEVWTKI